METVDLIIHARWLVPILPKNTVLEHHSIVVHQGQIIALLPQGKVARRYTTTNEQSYDQHCLMPGLITRMLPCHYYVAWPMICL